ncbi:hypothetical protein FKO01_25410 [Mesorhizobium sp. B2-3-3]|nr:hypothetical protein FKO01_25410 [Mesorhizobium sp. B2-3-3]
MATVVILAVLYGFSQFLGVREREYKALPENDRIRLAKIEADRLSIPFKTLTADQIYQYGLEQLKLRGQRQWQFLIGLGVIGFLVTGITLYAIHEQRMPTQPTGPHTSGPNSPVVQGVSGDVTINNGVSP